MSFFSNRLVPASYLSTLEGPVYDLKLLVTYTTRFCKILLMNQLLAHNIAQNLSFALSFSLSLPLPLSLSLSHTHTHMHHFSARTGTCTHIHTHRAYVYIHMVNSIVTTTFHFPFYHSHCSPLPSSLLSLYLVQRTPNMFNTCGHDRDN